MDAAAEYRLAMRQHRPSLELRAKLGAAALHAGALEEAATAYAELGKTDAASVATAADGLVRTARAAIGARDVATLRIALRELLSLAPSRLPAIGGGITVGLDETHGKEAPALVLAAAAASSGVLADSLMSVWAEAIARSGRCDVAARAFDGLLVRQASQIVMRAARGGLSGCRLDAGRAALAAGQLEEAEEQFRGAVALGIPDSTVRLAWVLIGDTRWAGGDTVVAIESYNKAIAGAGDENPIARRAREQLAKLTGNNDSI